jgi:peptidyl-prolyl cis-trans isomerase C
LVLSLGCEKIPFWPKKPRETRVRAPLKENIVAVIGNFSVTAQDLNKEIENFNALVTASGASQNRIDTKDKKVAYLRNDIVRKYMLYQEALDRGLDKKEDIIRDLEYAKINLLVSELLGEELKKIDVSSKEIEDFYNANKEFLVEPEQRKILEIVTHTEDEAKQVYIELLRGIDFSTLAKQYSKSKTASTGGDVGFIGFEIDPEKRIRADKFYEVAFSPSLEVGNISGIFKSPDGFYIIKLDSIKKPETKSLSELWDNIKSWLLLEKQKKAIEELSNKLTGEIKVEIYEEKID